MFSTAPRPLVEPLARPARRGLRAARDWLRRPRPVRLGWVAFGSSAYHLLWLSVVVLGCWWTLRIAWPFTIDDAGISYAYAKHIALGQGPVAAPGGPWVEGYSNPLWVLLLVPLSWLGLDLPEFAKVLATLAFAGSLLVGRRYLAELDRQRFWAWGATDALFALGLGLCIEFMVWVPAGLENALFGFALLLLADLDARESSVRGRTGWSGLAACALCLTRPEGVLYAAPVLLIKTLLALRDRTFARQLRSFLLCWLAPWFCYQVLHYAVFHAWVANTYLAKPASQTFGKGLDYLWTSLDESGLRMVLPLAAIGVIGQVRQKLVLLWQCVAGVLFALYAGGDWMPYGRFVALFAPSLLLLAACGLRNLVRAADWAARGRVPREIWAFLFSVPLLAGWRSWQEPAAVKLAKRPWCHFCERVTDMNRLRKIGQRAGLESVSVLTQDFGGPAWVSDERFYPIDFLGLCDRGLALVRRDHLSHGGSLGANFGFYQAALHEQPEPPTWVSLPRNFWPAFDRSPEYQSGYIHLDPRLLPRTRRDSFFGLSRAAIDDFFPPLAHFEFRRINERLTLLGSTAYLDLQAPGAAAAPQPLPVAGARLHAIVSLVPRARLAGDEELVLRVEAKNLSSDSPVQAIARGIDGLSGQLGAGDPLRFDFQLPLPATAAPSYRVVLGARDAARDRGKAPGAWNWITLAELTATDPLPRPERVLPRYPTALPVPLESELRRLEPRVARALEARQEAGNLLPPDTALVRALLDQGRALEARHSSSQAYLAEVWASQLDRNAGPSVTDAIRRLRPNGTDDRYTMELALLDRFYASGAASDLARLVGYYLSGSQLLEAEYFLERAPVVPSEPELWAALHAQLGSQLGSSSGDVAPGNELSAGVAHDPLGSLDFEQTGLSGWTGDLQAFHVGTIRDSQSWAWSWGYHGAQVLTSLGHGVRGRGTILSPEFRLDGPLLSVLVGGASWRTGGRVELLVDDRAVASASGNDSDFMFPAFWNVSEYQGKVARLRVIDESTGNYVLLDHVLSWR